MRQTKFFVDSLMNFLFSTFWRVAIFSFSLLFFGASIFVTSLLIFDRELPEKRLELKKEIFEVDVFPISVGKNQVLLKTWGNSRASKTVLIQSPLSQKIVQQADLVSGKFVAKGEKLFSLDTKKIQIAIRQMSNQVQSLELQSIELEEQIALSKKRQTNIFELHLIHKEALEKKEKSVELEKALFEKAESLYEQDHISNSEYLIKLAALENVEAAYLSSLAKLKEIEDQKIALSVEQSRLSQALEKTQKDIQHLIIELENLHDDLQRSEIKAPFSGKIVHVFVEKGQEIKAGQELARLRSVDESEISVFVPDSYFRWLYEGPLLKMREEELVAQKLDLKLVNRDFDKLFSDAFIKSIDQGINEKSRSLGLLLARKNPLFQDGRPVAEEELAPGMYCQVKIPLCELEQTFLLPEHCLQEGGKIYHVVLSQDLQQTELGVIENFEILHNDERGMIARLPEKYRHLLLINEPIKGVSAGDPLSIKNLKHF